MAKKQEIIERIRTNTNEVWVQYGWIVIIANLIMGFAFIYMIFKKRNK